MSLSSFFLSFFFRTLFIDVVSSSSVSLRCSDHSAILGFDNSTALEDLPKPKKKPVP